MSLRDTRLQDSMPLDWTGLSSPVAAKTLRQAFHSDLEMSGSGVSANTCVETLRGSVAARDLQVGDLVKTSRSGFSKLRWVGTSRLNGSQPVPMRCAMNGGQNNKTLLSADQLVLVEHDQSERLYGTRRVLCAARYLTAGDQFVPDEKVSPVFIHLLFDAIELVKCGAVWVESFCPDMDYIRVHNGAMARDIMQHMPRLANQQGLAAFVRDLPVLDRCETEALFQ